MKIIYLITTLLATTQTIQLSLQDRCACNEYPEQVCQGVSYCSWVDNSCVDLVCSTLEEQECTETKSELKCKWNKSDEICEDKSYTCADVTTKSLCSNNYGLDCVWNSFGQVCMDFTCQVVDPNDCNGSRCSLVNGKCSEPQKVDCKTITNCTGTTFAGDSSICYKNDNGECKNYSLKSGKCSDFSDSWLLCYYGHCNYNTETNLCNDQTCSDIDNEYGCSAFQNSDTSFVTCIWNGTSCVEAAQSDILTMKVSDCVINTQYHYTWNMTSFSCSQCTNLVQHPYFANITTSSYTVLVYIIGMLFLLQ